MEWGKLVVHLGFLELLVLNSRASSVPEFAAPLDQMSAISAPLDSDSGMYSIETHH